MDALVLPFLLAALAELGSPGQMLALALGRRFGAPAAILLGIATGAIVTAALAAAAGAALGPTVPGRARHLLLGVALLLLAFGRLRAPKRVDHARDWRRLGAWGASAVSFAILSFGGEVQMAVAALAAGGRSAWLVAPSAAAGMVLGSALPLAGGEALATGPAMRGARWVLAGLFAIAGMILALAALELI